MQISPTLIGLMHLALVLMAAFSGAMIASSFLMRSRRDRAERWRQAFNDRWTPHLFARISGDESALPPLPPEDRMLFLLCWLHLHGYVKAESATALTRCVTDLKLEAYATELMVSHHDWQRMVGLATMAKLALPEASLRLMAVVKNEPMPFVYHATSALLRIDPQQGLEALRQTLVGRDWFPPAMAELIRPHGELALPFLESVLRQAHAHTTRPLVRLLEHLEGIDAMPMLRQRLSQAYEPEEIAAIIHALGRMGSNDDRETVVAHAGDKHWVVRMECARALGRIGLADDFKTLLALSRDKVWWVRYRAAEACVALFGFAAVVAGSLAERDRFAREMQQHVLAERAVQ